MSKRDYYEVLQVTRTASHEEIKKSYRGMAMKFHPDRNPDDPSAEDRFKECSEAFQVLSDPEKRNVYDRFGHDGLQGSGFQGFHNSQDVFSHFQDLFGDFFGMGGFGGRGSRREAPERGNDLQTHLRITLREAIEGAKKEVTVRYAEPCAPCMGSGAKSGKRDSCAMCGGRGQVAHSRGAFVISTTCPTCEGEGSTVAERCPECRGRGHVEAERAVKVAVPAGIDDGQSLRLTSQGEPGRRGGPAGHLYVTISVQPDERFQREGTDIYHAVSLSFVQAVLGVELEVPSPDEKLLKVSIPSGVQPGETVILKGRGAPRLDRQGRGDFIVMVQVHVPKKLSSKAKKLLKELEQSLKE